MSHFPSTGLLSKEQRRLLLLMRDISYGRIDSLRIRDGSPVIDESTKAVRYVRLANPNSDSQAMLRKNLLEKQPVKEFFGFLENLGNGLIESLEIQDGLPFRMNVVETIGTQV